MRHAGKWFPQFVLGLIVFVIIINVIAAAIQPYMPIIGSAFAILLVGIAIAIAGFVIYGIIQFVRSRVNSDGSDDGLDLGGWE